MKTKVNPNTINPIEMNNMSSMLSMMNSIQKIGKGKRKYSIEVDKSDKRLLVKFLNEAKKQFADIGSSTQQVGVYNFFKYVIDLASSKDTTEIKLSYEEYEFLKKMLQDSVRGIEKMQFFWYQFIRRATTKAIAKQYRSLLKRFK